MSIETRFPSLEAMEQLMSMGMEEGMTDAVGQIDDILAENVTEQSDRGDRPAPAGHIWGRWRGSLACGQDTPPRGRVSLSVGRHSRSPRHDH